MANEWVKRCLIFNLSCSEIPILYPQDQRKFLNLTITNAGKNVEKPELSYLIGVNINWYRYRKTIWHFLVKVQDRHTLQPSNSTPRYVPWTLSIFLSISIFISISICICISISKDMCKNVSCHMLRKTSPNVHQH